MSNNPEMSIPFDKLNNPALQQLAHELKIAVSGLTAAEWRALLYACISDAFTLTWKIKWQVLKGMGRALKNAGEASLRFFVRKADEYTRDSGDAFQKDAEKVREAFVALPKTIRSKMDYFLSLSKDEQIECLIATTLEILVFFATAGGLDAEGGLPDSDIKLFGMGGHRSVLTHSIILGMGVEFGMRFTLNVIQKVYDRLPVPHHKTWDVIIETTHKTKGLAISALWLGIGVHLLKDAGLFSGNIKPVVGIPGEHSMLFHKEFLTTNAVLAGTFGIKPSLNHNKSSELKF